MFLCAAAALFIALSPLIHGLHLVLASHPHNFCNVCIDSTASHSHGKSHCCHSYVMPIFSSSSEDRSEGHDSDTCPLCRQFTQFLKNQVILQSPVAITLQNNVTEEQIYLPGHFFNISFSNIIPRAPPAC
jgi:hypothetical protein